MVKILKEHIIIGGNKMRAISVAYYWYLHKVNIGHGSPEFEPRNLSLLKTPPQYNGSILEVGNGHSLGF